MADDPALTFEVSVVPDANGRSYVFVLHLERWQHLNMQRKQGPDRATRWEVQDLFYAPGDTNTPGFNINAHGYRGPEIVLPKPSNVFRILCIGGSTTAEGSTDDQTYPAHLQEALRKRFPGKAIEVINCGVQGLRTRGQLVHLPRFLELQPDLVIGYLGVNDLKLDVSHPWIYTFGSMPPFPRETTRAILRRADWFFPRVENDNREAIRELTLPNLEALRRVLGARGTRLALTSIVHPPEGALTSLQGHILEYKVFANNYWSQYAAVANEEIEAWCRAKNVFYIPTHENFHHYDLMTDWCHTTDEGNRLKAHLMALCLEDYIRPALEELPDHS
jgi:lysophospholipase L1-like esterase